ncbi:MAG: methylated-DNA--[protein]-cysteine S-methyltransferase [Pirellulales bacterium]
MQTQTRSMLTARDVSASSTAVFSTRLGWMALVMRGNVLQRLSFGHRGADSAADAVGLEGSDCVMAGNTAIADLIGRLTRYAAGEFDDFLDVEVDNGHLSPFAAAVAEAVRRIPFGDTRSYGELAARVGRPRAARAVGGVMAKNRTPLIVPCHRVLASGGALGGFSAVDGVRMKRRLLELEASAAIAGVGVQPFRL